MRARTPTIPADLSIRASQLPIEFASWPGYGKPPDRVYGCFPFGAAVPESFPPLVRLLCLAHGLRPPASPTRSAGCPVVVDDEVRLALHGYLSGRSPGLLTLRAARLAGADELTARSARRDLQTARRFYATGPRALRRLRLRHRVPAGATSADGLHEPSDRS